MSETFDRDIHTGEGSWPVATPRRVGASGGWLAAAASGSSTAFRPMRSLPLRRCPQRGPLLPRLLAVLVWGAVVAVSGSAATSGEEGEAVEGLARYAATSAHMGTQFRIEVFADEKLRAGRALRAAFEAIEQLDRRMSDYREDSELSRLSAASPTEQPVAVSADLATVLRESQRMYRLTGGAFDVTVGPLSRLWRKARKQKQLPDAQQLQAARASVGGQFLRIDPEGNVRLLRPKMRLDLGGIAKGFAADRALAVLKQHGIARALIDAGGDLVLGDPPPGRGGWRIAVAPLRADAPQGSRVLEVSNCGVATSGDAFQFVEIDGQRYSHLLDPRTGLGVVGRSSATVIAPSGMQADACASALSVMGGDGLARLEELPGVAAILVLADPSGEVRAVATRGVAAYELREGKSGGEGSR